MAFTHLTAADALILRYREFTWKIIWEDGTAERGKV
jgi:hypothetical protein